MLRAVIFDFDYTLGDTTAGITAAFNYAFSEMGLSEHTEDEVKVTVGQTLHESFRILTGNDSKEAADRFYDLFQIAAKRTLVPSASLYPNTLETIRFFQRLGCKLGIVTSKHRHQIVDIFDKFGITGDFDIIVGAEDVKKYKPDPEGVLFALDSLGVARSDALYVGDSFVDGEAAMRAGVPFAAVLTGTTGMERLLSYSPVIVAPEIGGIMKYIERVGVNLSGSQVP